MKTLHNTGVISKALGRFSPFIYLRCVSNFPTLSTSTAPRYLVSSFRKLHKPLVAIRRKMVRLIQIMILSLTALQLQAQNEIEIKSDSLINQMSDDRRAYKASSTCNQYFLIGLSHEDTTCLF